MVSHDMSVCSHPLMTTSNYTLEISIYLLSPRTQVFMYSHLYSLASAYTFEIHTDETFIVEIGLKTQVACTYEQYTVISGIIKRILFSGIQVIVHLLHFVMRYFKCISATQRLFYDLCNLRANNPGKRVI